VTFTGTSLLLFAPVLTPSWLKLLSPHAITAPLLSSASVWLPPAEIALTPVRPVTGHRHVRGRRVTVAELAARAVPPGRYRAAAQQRLGEQPARGDRLDAAQPGNRNRDLGVLERAVDQLSVAIALTAPSPVTLTGASLWVRVPFPSSPPLLSPQLIRSGD
jgi:hypothetical protein